MSQKIKPSSLRLGLIQLWDVEHQTYGSTLKRRTKDLFKYINTFVYIKKMISLDHYLIHNLKLSHDYKSIIFIVSIATKNYKKKKIVINIFLYLSFYFLNNINLKIIFYNNIKRSYTTLFYKCYINYLFYKLNYSPRKIINILSRLLKNQIGVNKIIDSSKGPVNLKLMGYKLILKGRFENTKNQMAKKMNLSNGSVKLTTLDNYIDYIDVDLYTKLGICTIKIWIFYAKNNEKNT